MGGEPRVVAPAGQCDCLAWVREPRRTLDGSQPDKTLETGPMTDRTEYEYERPQLEVFGNLRDLTLVGGTNPGPDTFPGESPHETGSVCPPNGMFCD